MGFEITISESGKYLVIRVSGEITVELARQFSIEAAVQGDKHHLQRFLFDVREAPNVESMMRNYMYVTEDMEDLNLSRTVRSAILTSPEDRSHDFIETAIRNAGYNVRLFTDREAAVAWLEE